jgi:hypothetical protein
MVSSLDSKYLYFTDKSITRAHLQRINLQTYKNEIITGVDGESGCKINIKVPEFWSQAVTRYPDTNRSRGLCIDHNNLWACHSDEDNRRIVKINLNTGKYQILFNRFILFINNNVYLI